MTPPRPAGRPPAGRPAGRVRLGSSGGRLHGGLIAVLVMLSLIAGRLVWLQGFQAEAYAAKAVEQRLSTKTLTAPRGTITDRTGQALALSVDARAVYGEPRIIAKAVCGPDSTARPCDPASIAAAVAPVLGLPVAEVEQKLGRPSQNQTCGKATPMGCTGFVYLARGLDPDVSTKVRKLGLVGVGTIAEPRRVHPGKDLAANVVGFTTVEGQGAAGIELQLDEVLAGQNGVTTAEVDGGGRIIPGGSITKVEPQPGDDVQLTLDRDLQWYAQKALADVIEKSDAESGSATVLDVQTGEILALASVPTFDADDPGASDAAVRGNRAINDVFEPGSIGKVITAAAALESGQFTPDTVLSVPDNIQLSNKRFRDSHSHPTERMTFTGVLVESSNVGTIMAAQKVGGPKLYEALQRFGIGRKTGLGLPGESAGILRDEKDWSGTDYGTHPIGQGYSVNGVQMASVYATVANDGVRVTPTIFKSSTDATGRVAPAAAPERTRVLQPEIAAQLRGMLEGVTNEGGTAVKAAIPGYRVAGKTGTAQRVVDGRYDGSYTASFVGFAPADAPRLAVSVSIQAPKNGYYGGTVAGPVFRDIMSFALRSMRVPPTGAVSPTLRLRG
ncbi:MAG: peptidoglycan D,D-transpeptidase FtsI family protein [Mycobacteriales bacterium]